VTGSIEVELYFVFFFQEALAVAKDRSQALNIPVKVPLGGGRYAELTEWNGSKRVDLRFWKTDTIPTSSLHWILRREE
jgi:hypothetical protein